MSYDLVLGKTSRDWSCGSGPVAIAPSPVPVPASGIETIAAMNPTTLAINTRNEIARCANTIMSLKRASRLPEAEFVAYRKFHSKWIDFWDFHSGKFRSQDLLNLWNLREINRQFIARVKILGKLAQTPIKRPVSPSGPLEKITETSLTPVTKGPSWLFWGISSALVGILSFLGGRQKI